MLSRDVRFEGFSAEEWLGVLSLFRPRRARGRTEGGVLAVLQGDRVAKLLSTARGRLDPREQPWPVPLSELARRHDAAFALAFDEGCLDELMDRLGARILPEHDYLAQLLEFLKAAQELEAERRLEVWPWQLAAWPLPSSGTLLAALDLVCRPGQSIVLGVFDRGALETCIGLGRAPAGFDRILGPDLLRPRLAQPSGDLRRDYRQLAAAASELLGPIALGCYAERRTLERLLDAPAEPGAWAAAAARGDVIVAPASAIVAVPLGIDLARAAAAGARRLLGATPGALLERLKRSLG